LVVICPVCLSISNSSVYACPVGDPVCDPILSTIVSRSSLCRNREEDKSLAPYGGFRKDIRVLTITVLVLLRSTMSAPDSVCEPSHFHAVGFRGRGALTNREKASLNSETCSSVRESAYQQIY
jgi:hypothetical protein